MYKRLENFTHLKKAFIGDFAMKSVDGSEELKLILLDLSAELIESEYDPLKLFFADGVPKEANRMVFL